ncbi:hypothetical protein WT09_10615 [Burkholderia stagnalis]|uniref:TonB-dependent siderophore receptor n=1 Tax=Burkholderia stagnalis TaxID=1503054 RepID=UPI00075A03AB|nr:TonB-dependent receptor [Burkholderia stagnalis]KVN19086.1 hypothetical protein WT09_10615 [Burkholderia stagnalis]
MKQSNKPEAKALCKLVAAIVFGMATVPLYAQTSVNLPSQPLSATLSQLARQADVNILAPDNVVAGRVAPAVSGVLTVQDALTQVLKGTGLRVERVDPKTYVIKKYESTESAVSSKSGKEAVLPTLTVSDRSITEGNGFIADSTSTATRTDTPISLTPQSIQVVTKDLLRSKQTQSVTEALAYVGGVTVQDTGNRPQVSIRGFAASTMSNGHNDTGSSNSLDVPMAGVERIEVLKGADSILSGAMYPGGIVNVVTKRPTAETVRELTFQTGSYGNLMGAIDLGGALTSDKALRYRFVLSAERAGQSFGGFDGKGNFYLAPSIEWKSRDTDIVLGYQRQVVNTPPQQITLLRPSDDPFPIHSRATPAANSLYQMDTVSVDVTQRLGSIFQFESKAQYQASSFALRGFYEPIGGTPASTLYLGAKAITSSYGFDLDNHVQAKFSVGPIKQTFIAGVSNNVYWSTISAPPTLVFVAPFPLATIQPDTGPWKYSAGGKSYSSTVYFQDQLAWDRLHILASIARGTSWSHNVASQSQWTPNIGILYQLTDNIAAYGNAMRSFVPQQGSFLLDGSVAPPRSGRSVEAGFKFNFFDDRLNVTADVFRTAETNVVIGIPGTPFVTLGGGRAMRGAELSVNGRLLPGLNVAANETYSSQQQQTDGTSTVPRHSASLWLTYDLQGERWHGWGVGVGIEARSGYQLSQSASNVVYKVPGQAQTDASVYYQSKQWAATLGVKNLFNRTLYQSNTFAHAVALQPGRLIYLTGRYKF